MSKRNYYLVTYSLTPHDDEEEEIEGAIEGIVEPDNMNSMMEPPSQQAQPTQQAQPIQQAQPTQQAQPEVILTEADFLRAYQEKQQQEKAGLASMQPPTNPSSMPLGVPPGNPSFLRDYEDDRNRCISFILLFILVMPRGRDDFPNYPKQPLRNSYGNEYRNDMPFMNNRSIHENPVPMNYPLLLYLLLYSIDMLV